MTFEQWWREHEAELSARFYKGDRWTNIYGLLREAWEAGKMGGEGTEE